MLNYSQANIIPYSELFHPDVIRFSISRNYQPLISSQIRSVSMCLWSRSFMTVCVILSIFLYIYIYVYICVYMCTYIYVYMRVLLQLFVSVTSALIFSPREHCNLILQETIAPNICQYKLSNDRIKQSRHVSQSHYRLLNQFLREMPAACHANLISAQYSFRFTSGKRNLPLPTLPVPTFARWKIYRMVLTICRCFLTD